MTSKRCVGDTFLIEAVRRSDQFAAPLGWTEIYVLRKFADVIKRADHGRTPVHEQVAKMYGQVTEHAQMEIFARGMPRELARALQVKAGSPALTVVRRYYGAHEELFEVTVTTHPEGRSNWLERGIVEHARERFAVPITHVVVDLEAERDGGTVGQVGGNGSWQRRCFRQLYTSSRTTNAITQVEI